MHSTSFDVLMCIRIFPLQLLQSLFLKRKQFCSNYGNVTNLPQESIVLIDVSVSLFVTYFIFLVSISCTQGVNIVLSAIYV